MTTVDERLSLEIIHDFRRVGYSYLKLPKQLVLEADSLARFLYDLDVSARVLALAKAESGVLGYYPSEMEAYEIGRNFGTDISTWTGSKSRGYSSYDFIEEPSVVLGSSPVLRANVWIPVPVFRERALALYRQFKSISTKISRRLNSTLSSMSNGSLSIDDYLHRDSLSIMRILNYRMDELRDVSKEHTDYEFLTLSISTAEGLEVKTPSGDWQKILAKEDHAVLLPGDMFEVASRGYVKSTLHRARCAGEPRRAVIFFQGLPLDFAFDYAGLGDFAPRSFGEHIIAMLIRGAAHLAPDADRLAKELNIAIPLSNPFRAGK